MAESTGRVHRAHGECGYGWVVVAATFFVCFIVDGLVYSFGILFVELLEYFQQDRASTVVIGSILFGFMYIIGPVAGALSNIYESRIIVVIGAIISCTAFVISSFATSVLYMCITYGFLGGVGLGLMYLPAGVCVIHHFTKRRALANGFACCGSGVGTFAMNHFTRYLLDQYGVRGTMMLQGGLVLQCVVLGLLLLPPEHETGEQELEKVQTTDKNTLSKRTIRQTDSEKTCCSCLFPSKHRNHNLDFEETTFDVNRTSDIGNNLNNNTEDKMHYLKRIARLIFHRELLTSVMCWSFLICNFTVQLAYTIPFNLLADQSVENGISKHDVSWIMSSIGITNTLGRVLLGALADRKCINRLSMLKIILLMTGLSTAVSPLFTTFGTKVLYACIYGFLVGGYVVLCPVVLADLFGTFQLAQSFGLWMFACGLAGSIASPIGGWLFDITGTYDTTFLVAGIEFVVGGLLLFIPKCILYARRKR